MQYHGKSSYFFNNYKNSQEQLLLDLLVSESIAIFGKSMIYCPRTLNNFNRRTQKILHLHMNKHS